MTTKKRTRQHITARSALLVAVLLPVLLLATLFHITKAAATASPVLDLNGELPGQEYTATYTEDESPRAIVSQTGLSVTDDDSDKLQWARATLQEAPDGALEVLAADPGETGIVVKFKPATRVLELTGDKTLAEYQEVLRSVTYVNSSQGPDPSDRVVVFEVYDGTSRSAPVTSTVTINAVNDAPLLDNTGTMMLVDINENTFNSLGNKVETIIASAGGDRITDPDRNAVEGIAVIEVGTGNGTWQYSLDAGANWVSFQGVSNQTATVLDPLARVRFVPNPNYSGSASFMFRAWDQTQGASGNTGIDVTQNGGTTAFSTATESASINVQPVNDPPVVDLNGVAFGSNFNTGYLGSNVSVPIADKEATITDPDSQTLAKATVRLTNRPDGALEVLAASKLATAITIQPYDPATGVLVLTGPDTVAAFQSVLRTVAYVNSSITATGGGRLIEVIVNDGASDSSLATTTIAINPANQAPSLSAPGGLLMSNVPEDALDPPGNTVAAILASGGDPITDPDAGALEGIAITGADNTRGVWQYASQLTLDGAPIWQPVGVVSDTAAVLLNTEGLLRFVPNANYAGPSGNLSIRAWDQTSGATGQRNVNVAVNGGSTAFSTQTVIASLTVTPVNDPPSISYTPTGPLVYQEHAPPLPLLSGTLVITDVDNANLPSATVSLLNRPDEDAETLAVTVGGTGLVANYSAGVLVITGQAPAETYQQVLATLTYANTSHDPDVADRQIQVVVSDGATSSMPLTLNVEIVAINDPPLVDLNGAAPGIDYSANFYIQWRPARITDPNMVVIDLDDTSLQSVSVRLVNPLDGTAESLSARVFGTSIKQSYDPVTGILLLSGVDSVTNYQKVLRSVTYNNTLATPSTTPRTVEFQARDALDPGLIARSAISIQPTPTANLFMPIVGRRSEEPNDACAEAPVIALNRSESYYADDRNDWFYFDLVTRSTVVVRLTNFAPGDGQLIVAGGTSCRTLKLLGSNGDNETSKMVDIGRRDPGRYYVWIINDGVPNTVDPYTLKVDAQP